MKIDVTISGRSQLALYASGDEFYHWIHDKDGYTIVQAEDGYCYYAIKNDKGELVPSIYRVDDELPSKTKIVPWLKISKQQYDKRRERMQIQPMTRTTKPQYASHKNPLNNIVIFVSFKDATTFSKKRSVYDSRFNSTTSSSGSLKDYYKEVSYSVLSTIFSCIFLSSKRFSKPVGISSISKVNLSSSMITFLIRTVA